MSLGGLPYSAFYLPFKVTVTIAAMIHFNSGLFIWARRLMILLAEYFRVGSGTTSIGSISGVLSIPAGMAVEVLRIDSLLLFNFV